MPLTAHLEELRTRLIRALLAIAIGFAACYGFSEPLVTFLIRPLQSIRPEQPLVIGQLELRRRDADACGRFLADPTVHIVASHVGTGAAEIAAGAASERQCHPQQAEQGRGATPPFPRLMTSARHVRVTVGSAAR